MSAAMPYDPSTFRGLTFHDAVSAFLEGADSPAAYLERCIAGIEQRDPTVRAWQALRIDAARADAQEANRRYRAGTPLSAIDGMPIGIKDLIQTRDLPTGEGIEGNESSQGKVDSASVQALRAAGAVILGKLVTTELGGGHPSVTTNPFDASRTPGGSSSGSAAAIGARMLPAAIGTQVGGSIIRPAGYCGNYAIKPTFGALNRGERQGSSQSCVGVHAGSVEDLWAVTYEIGRRAGGDPGHPGLFGAAEAPRGSRPSPLVVMESDGWQQTDAVTRDAFMQVLDQLREQGVVVLHRRDDPYIEAFEGSLANAAGLVGRILAFENRWALENLVREHATLSDSTLASLERARAMTVDDYRLALRERSHAQQRFSALAPIGDALISLTAPGPATPLQPLKYVQGDPLPSGTGNPAFALPASLLLAPALAVPLLAINALPLGIQLIGQRHDDYRLVAFARWMVERVTPVAVGERLNQNLSGEAV